MVASGLESLIGFHISQAVPPCPKQPGHLPPQTHSIKDDQMKTKLTALLSALGPGLAIGIACGVAMDSLISGLGMTIAMTLAFYHSAKVKQPPPDR